MTSSLAAASRTSLVPPVTSPLDTSISDLTSAEACAALCASRRTSTATTAKPLPASPARAASTEAFSASKLVWKAMSSISPMMLEILPEDCVIRSIASLARCITAPPSAAVWLTSCAFLLACCARFALSDTVEASCSIAAEVSSIVADCLVVRSERSLAPERISPVAVFSAREVVRISPTISDSLSLTALVSLASWPKAPW